MSQLPLEDQLRSMILKNSAPSDNAQQHTPNEQSSLNSNHPAVSQNPASLPQQSPVQPTQPRPGRNANRAPPQHLPPQSPHAASPRLQHQTRQGPHHGRGQSGPGRQTFGTGSPQQRQQGFSPQQQRPGYVPPHMRNRSVPGDLGQQSSPSGPPNGPWRQSPQSGSSPRAHPPSPGNFGSPRNYRQMPPPSSLQIVQRPHQGGSVNGPFRPGPPLYDPNSRYRQHQAMLQEQLQTQSKYLDAIATVEIPKVAMTDEELKEKEDFVQRLQHVCQDAISSNPDVPNVEFKCFGSIGTGFATKGSDIDLAVVAMAEADAELAKKVGPRALEKIFLDEGYGARLLTNTRVPIIKFCESPSEELHANLKAERKKWDDLPEDEKIASMEGGRKIAEGEENGDGAEATEEVEATGDDDAASPKDNEDTQPDKKAASKRKKKNKRSDATESTKSDEAGSSKEQESGDKKNEVAQSPTTTEQGQGKEDGDEKKDGAGPKPRHERPWLRERPMGPLDFPKDGVGIQCDLNFAGHLGIYNTKLLHCYAISDRRVRDMVIFVKAWAKTRKINSSYNGTLSSYGYALMVLHYLIRVPEEPVIPDLQLLNNLPVGGKSPTWIDVTCNGHLVKFLADEEYILDKVRQGQWTRNHDSLGSLLRGFFRYYGCPGVPDRVGGFHWTRDVITFGQRRPWERLVTKEELGWTKARIEKDTKKEVRHRYLVCIQDPFELDHNVGRTVNHQGICAIREEFRRAWRILEDEAHGRPHKDLFATVEDDPPPPQFVGGQNKTNQTADQGRNGPHVRTESGDVVLNAESGLDKATLLQKKGIHSTVDGAKLAEKNASAGFGAEAIAKVNGKLAEAARKQSLQ